jgi:hypothetical protein
VFAAAFSEEIEKIDIRLGRMLGHCRRWIRFIRMSESDKIAAIHLVNCGCPNPAFVEPPVLAEATALRRPLHVEVIAPCHLLIEIGPEQFGHAINHVGSIPTLGWPINIERVRHDAAVA